MHLQLSCGALDLYFGPRLPLLTYLRIQAGKTIDYGQAKLSLVCSSVQKFQNLTC